MQVVRADGQRHLDGHGIAAHAVVVQVAAEGITALPQLGDPVEQAAARIGDHVIHRAQHRVQSHLADQALHGGGAAAVRGHLHAQIQHALLGIAGVGADQAQHVLVGFAMLRDAAGGNADAFLEDGFQPAGDRPRHCATHVGMVRDIGREKAQFVAPENGGHDVDVGQVAAVGQIGVVADEDIAFADLADGIRAQDRPHRAVQRAQVQGDLRALRHQPALDVE
ncbi:hypothetical protein D9M68_788730 [compost metagenome]